MEALFIAEKEELQFSCSKNSYCSSADIPWASINSMETLNWKDFSSLDQQKKKQHITSCVITYQSWFNKEESGNRACYTEFLCPAVSIDSQTERIGMINPLITDSSVEVEYRVGTQNIENLRSMKLTHNRLKYRTKATQSNSWGKGYDN
jgi:hypothetical protein